MTTAVAALPGNRASPWAGIALLASILLTFFFAACVAPASASSSDGDAQDGSQDLGLPGEGGNDDVSSDGRGNDDGAGVEDERGNGDVNSGRGTQSSGSRSGDNTSSQLNNVSDRTFQWVGVLELSNLEGRFFELNRGCDRWALVTDDPETLVKLARLAGSKAIIWGRVLREPSILMRQAIKVESVFGPNEPMPQTLVAIPEYPCPTPQPKPAPGAGMEFKSGEVAARGLLVWENWRPYLNTPSGRIALALPPDSTTLPGVPQAQAGAADAQNFVPPALDVVGAGNWAVRSSLLTLTARSLRSWPVRLVVPVTCDNGAVNSEISVVLEQGELAARGNLARTGDRVYVKTEGGAVYLSPPPQDAAQDPTGSPEVVAAGKWKLTGTELSISPRVVHRTDRPCPPPPFQPLLPGEIAALGSLVWENGQAFLDTPSGKIVLRIPAAAETQAVPQGSGALSADALRQGQGNPTSVPQQIVVVGKWSIVEGKLTIAVRYALPWPLPTGWLNKLPLPAQAQAGQSASGAPGQTVAAAANGMTIKAVPPQNNNSWRKPEMDNNDKDD